MKLEELQAIVDELKVQDRTIVFCNGVFDILHAGHIAFLKEAKEQGDVLIVGINSDESVTKNKGPGRPVNKEKDRARVLEALEDVDYTIIFNEENPIKVIKALKPDVFVNGEEYGEGCVEAPTVKSYGGKIHLIKKIHDISTTDLIKKLRS